MKKLSIIILLLAIFASVAMSQSFVDKAVDAATNGNYKEALKNIDKAIKQNSKKPEYDQAQLFEYKGLICAGMGDLRSAQEAMTAALLLDPDNEEYLGQAARIRAQVALSKDQYRQFIDELIAYMDYTFDYDREMIDIAKRVDQNYFIACISMKQNVKNRDFWTLLRAMTYEDAKMYEKALAEYAILEKHLPEGIDIRYIWSSMAECSQESYNYPEAIRCYTLFLDSTKTMQNSERAWYYLQRAESYAENGELQKSIADWDTVLVYSPELAYFAYYKRGLAKEKMLDNDGAFDDYCLGIKADDRFAYLYLMRGEQYMVHRHDTVKARADFRQILELESEPIDGSCRHYALLFLGYRNEAFEWLQKIIELNPEDPGHYYDGACLSARAGEYDSAVKYLERALALGYGRFKHIEQDDDLDPIRERQDFKALIEKYR